MRERAVPSVLGKVDGWMHGARGIVAWSPECIVSPALGTTLTNLRWLDEPDNWLLANQSNQDRHRDR